MKLSDTFLGFLLELLGTGSEIGVLISEQLIRYLAGKQYSYICGLMYSFTYKVHTHTCSDGRDIIGTKDVYYFLQRIYNLFGCHKYFGMIASDIVSYLLGIFKIDSVLSHTYRKCTDGLIRSLCRNGTYQ